MSGDYWTYDVWRLCYLRSILATEDLHGLVDHTPCRIHQQLQVVHHTGYSHPLALDERLFYNSHQVINYSLENFQLTWHAPLNKNQKRLVFQLHDNWERHMLLGMHLAHYSSRMFYYNMDAGNPSQQILASIHKSRLINGECQGWSSRKDITDEIYLAQIRCRCLTTVSAPVNDALDERDHWTGRMDMQPEVAFIKSRFPINFSCHLV